MAHPPAGDPCPPKLILLENFNRFVDGFVLEIQHVFAVLIFLVLGILEAIQLFVVKGNKAKPLSVATLVLLECCRILVSGLKDVACGCC